MRSRYNGTADVCGGAALTYHSLKTTERKGAVASVPNQLRVRQPFAQVHENVGQTRPDVADHEVGIAATTHTS